MKNRESLECCFARVRLGRPLAVVAGNTGIGGRPFIKGSDSVFGTRCIHLVLIFCLAALGGGMRLTLASEPDLTSDEGYALRYAIRSMNRLDINKDSRFEPSEDERAWRRMKRFDTNRDGVLTLDEIRASKFSYLVHSGPRKLNLIYKTVGEKKLHLDIYYPVGSANTQAGDQTSDPLPTVFYTHGGGWAAGSKHGIANGSFQDVYARLLNNGFCVVAMNYRLYRKDEDVTIRDCVVDSKDAVRFVAKHSATLGVDPQRFFAHGDSAGGQLAQMLLLSTPESFAGDPELADARYRMIAGVSWYGPCDFEDTELYNHDGRPDFPDRFGARIMLPDSDPAEKLRRYREVSPVNYLAKSSPPLLMIQGDSDTTIPIHHANYMKQRADEVGAPVETMLIRNAGHNWREAGGSIEPGREAIVQRTVEYLVTRVPPASKPKKNGTSSLDPMPLFTWDTIPRYVHVRKTQAFTKEEIQYLATFPLITFEKTTGLAAYGSTDRGTLAAAQAVKRINDDAKILFYRNVMVHYSGYSFDERLKQIESPFLINKTGEDKLVRGRVQAYDLSNREVVDWWVSSMAGVCNDDAIDGLFLDGNVKVLSDYLKRDLPTGKKQNITDGFDELISRTRRSLKPNKLMIANILRARFDEGGMEFIAPFDGSYLEGFEHPVAGVTRADYIAKGIRVVRQAASKGKIIALTLRVNPGKLSDGIDERPNVLDRSRDDFQARLDYCLALFLVMAERHSYLNIHDGYDVNPRGNQGSVSKFWLQDFPEYQRPLGPPKGPPEQDGYRYAREFEHATVELDIEAERGVIRWR